MSLTNPNAVVTEERLAEFYQGIFPYLGGMPEILANKFSKSDLYSTDEKMIGQWTDNKPLYQRTFRIDLATQSTITTDRQWIVLQDLSSLNPDEIFIADGFIHLDSDSAPLTAYTQSSGDSAYWMTRIWDKKIHVLSCGNSWYKQGLGIQGYVIIIVQYTKTTDSAISIGNDTDYSTTEKIIGTWINGKPIYQKTFSIKAPTVTTAGTMAEKSTPHGIDNIGTRIMCIQHGSASTQIFGNSNSISYLTVYADATSLNVRTNNTIWSNADIFVTLQYTKTTD